MVCVFKYPARSWWRLEASKNDRTWAILYSGHDNYISNIVTFFSRATSPLTSFYKLTVYDTEGVIPDLSYFQLFAYDNIQLPYFSEIAGDNDPRV